MDLDEKSLSRETTQKSKDRELTLQRCMKLLFEAFDYGLVPVGLMGTVPKVIREPSSNILRDLEQDFLADFRPANNPGIVCGENSGVVVVEFRGKYVELWDQLNIHPDFNIDGTYTQVCGDDLIQHFFKYDRSLDEVRSGDRVIEGVIKIKFSFYGEDRAVPYRGSINRKTGNEYVVSCGRSYDPEDESTSLKISRIPKGLLDCIRADKEVPDKEEEEKKEDTGLGATEETDPNSESKRPSDGSKNPGSENKPPANDEKKEQKDKPTPPPSDKKDPEMKGPPESVSDEKKGVELDESENVDWEEQDSIILWLYGCLQKGMIGKMKFGSRISKEEAYEHYEAATEKRGMELVHHNTLCKRLIDVFSLKDRDKIKNRSQKVVKGRRISMITLPGLTKAKKAFSSYLGAPKLFCRR